MKNKKVELVDYMGTKVPAHYLEKPSSSGKKATTIIRRRQPTLQEQIASMLRFHQEREESLDEDFSDGDEYGDDTTSPHELVRDEETGLEMCRYEKQLLDAQRPKIHENAVKEALRQKRKKIPKNKSPDPQRSEDQDSHEGEGDAE